MHDLYNVCPVYVLSEDVEWLRCQLALCFVLWCTIPYGVSVFTI